MSHGITLRDTWNRKLGNDRLKVVNFYLTTYLQQELLIVKRIHDDLQVEELRFVISRG